MNVNDDAPPIFPVRNDRLEPMSWFNYSKMVSASFNLFTKWSIIRNLIELAKLHSDPSKCGTFSKLWEGVKESQFVIRQQMLSMQAISSTMDLTENFAGMCFAYTKAIKHGLKFFPVIIRDFGNLRKAKHYKFSKLDFSRAKADLVYEDILASKKVAREYLACQDLTDEEVLGQQEVISTITDFRKNYVDWYNRFKHSNAVFPIEWVFDVPGTFSLLHRIPDHIKWSDERVEFTDKDLFASTIKKFESKVLGKTVSKIQSDSMLSAYQKLDDVWIILGLMERFWQPIHAKQHYALFKEQLPVYRS